MPSSTSFPASPAEPALPRLALEVRGLTGPADLPVIRDITLSVMPGARLLVLGPIDAGKSMVMRHVLGLERAVQGTIAIDGFRFDPTRPDDRLLRSARSRVGAVFESPALLSDITVVENVELPLLEHDRLPAPLARRAARDLLHDVGLDLADDVFPHALDRAQRRAVALARAAALRPALLLLDEPTTGLDPAAAHVLDSMIDEMQLRTGAALVVFTREVRYAFRWAGEGEIAVMDAGAVVECGSLSSLMKSAAPMVRRLLHRRGQAS